LQGCLRGRHQGQGRNRADESSTHLPFSEPSY
jgi:hypothetical protein